MMPPIIASRSRAFQTENLGSLKFGSRVMSQSSFGTTDLVRKYFLSRVIVADMAFRFEGVVGVFCPVISSTAQPIRQLGLVSIERCDFIFSTILSFSSCVSCILLSVKVPKKIPIFKLYMLRGFGSCLCFGCGWDVGQWHVPKAWARISPGCSAVGKSETVSNLSA